jgi:hypothetical protein
MTSHESTPSGVVYHAKVRSDGRWTDYGHTTTTHVCGLHSPAGSPRPRNFKIMVFFSKDKRERLGVVEQQHFVVIP